MGPKFNYDSERKASEEEEVDSVEGRFHGEMHEKEEFRIFVQSMLKGMEDI